MDGFGRRSIALAALSRIKTRPFVLGLLFGRIYRLLPGRIGAVKGLTFGLLFRVPPDFRDSYRGIGVDFPLIYGNDSWFLPIPATYVIDRDGTIRHAYVNPDFRERLDPQEILAVLKSLQIREERDLTP